MTARRPIRRRIAVAALFAFAVELLGCANLDAVAKFAASAQQAQAGYPALVADLPASCVRRVDFKMLAGGQTDQSSFGAIEQKECGEYAQFAPGLTAAGNTLFDYLSALGALAAGKPPGYRATLSGLPGKLGASNAFGPAQTQAFVALAQFVLDSATRTYRQAALGRAIEARNNDVQAVTAALNSVVVSDYENLLTLEEQEMRNYYLSAIKSGEARQPLTVPLIELRWSHARAAIARNRKGAAAFGAMLSEIAKTHGELAANAANLDSRTMLESVLQSAGEAASMAGEFAAAFPQR